MDHAAEIENSARYLASDTAALALETDSYWPKWHSPWWHMLLLHETGHTQMIPERIVAAYVARLNGMPLKIFPIHPEDVPPGVDAQRGSPCHCQLGSVYQVLAARGVAVDRELPWIRPWFTRYQMADGGLNCDNDAYLVRDECPSSMVGTIAPFEAVLLHTPRAWTAEETAFLDRAADFLMARELRLGSATRHNAGERVSAQKWGELCFPRYYFYDVLRGLSALSIWAEKTGRRLPAAATRAVVAHLDEKFPDGNVRVGRRGFDGTHTIAPTPSGEWQRRDASFFPLLDRVSAVGEISPYLTRQWQETRHRLQSAHC